MVVKQSKMYKTPRCELVNYGDNMYIKKLLSCSKQSQCFHADTKCKNVSLALLFLGKLNFSVSCSCLPQSTHVVCSRDSGKCLHHFRECGPWRKPLVDRQHRSQNHRVSKSTTGFSRAHAKRLNVIGIKNKSMYHYRGTNLHTQTCGPAS